MMLSEHFSLEELTASEVAARAGIDNTPSAETMRNLLRLAAGLELVRAAIGNNPIHVTSGYRSPRLNQMVGGAKNSMLKLDKKIDVAFWGLFATNEGSKNSDLFHAEVFQLGRMIAKGFEDFSLCLNTCAHIHHRGLMQRHPQLVLF